MKVVVFGNGSIGKTLRAVHDFSFDVISVDFNKKSKPDLVGDANDERLRRRLLDKGDIFVDLTSDNDAVPVSEWCQDNGVGYINSDMSYPTGMKLGSIEKRFKQIVGIGKKKNLKGLGTTVLYCHGMNPGMVSHYFSEIVSNFEIASGDIEEVHVSEIDTQISDMMPEQETLISTWCVGGNFMDTVDSSSLHKKDYWRSRLGKINRLARDNKYWTRNPWDGKFKTYLSGNHEEVYEIGLKHNVPVCFSYKSPVQFNEGSKLLGKDSNFKPHIMSEDTICGHNAVGIYLRKRDGSEYWCGSRLDISSARKKVKNDVADLVLNATTVLTASGVYAATRYLMENPGRGWMMPLDAESSTMVDFVRPFLGEYFMGRLP